MFHLPYKLRTDGGDCLTAIAAGKEVGINLILGMPFIPGMGTVLDFKDNVATCNAIDHPPFTIDHRHTARTVHASAVGVNAGISFHPCWKNSVLANNGAKEIFWKKAVFQLSPDGRMKNSPV